MFNPKLAAGALGLAGLALTACGSPVTSPSASSSAGSGAGGPSAATISGSGRACSLVSASDAARIVGKLSFSPAENDQTKTLVNCDYTLAADNGNQDLSITLGTDAASHHDIEAYFGLYETATTVLKKVPGLGPSAVDYNTPTGIDGTPTGAGSGCSLSVTKGAMMLIVQIDPSAPDCLRKVQQIAKIALGNA